jgi:hypothetical protein
MDDSEEYWITKRGVGSSGNIQVAFAIKCDAPQTQTYIAFLPELDPEIMGLSVTSVRLRFDKGEPFVLEGGGDFKLASFSEASIGKVPDLMRQASTMAFELHFSNVSEILNCLQSGGSTLRGTCSSPVSRKMQGKVDLAGAGYALDWFGKRCGSFPQPEPAVIIDPREQAALAARQKEENDLAEKLRLAAEGKVQLELFGQRESGYGVIRSKIRVRNNSEFFICSKSIEQSFSFSAGEQVEFFQKGISLGRSFIASFNSLKDDVGLDTNCIAGPASTNELGTVDLPTIDTPDAILLRRENSLEVEVLHFRTSAYGNEFRKEAAFIVDTISLPDIGFYKLERVRGDDGRYKYLHTPVDWVLEAQLQINKSAGEP